MKPSKYERKFFNNHFSTLKMRQIFSDYNMIQKQLDVEAALARVQAKLGIIPTSAAEEITRKAKAELMDFEEMQRELEKTGHPLIPLIRVLKKTCEGNAGEYLHWGAAAQDILDSGMILQVREAYNVILTNTERLCANVCELADKHRNLIMVGRSMGQHALPITFGFKCAVWAEEIRRNIERLKECKNRLLVGQFCGAVGTFASLGDIGFKVQEMLMEELDLGIPKITWHPSRDNIAEFISCIGMIAATTGKIANEVYLLQKPEIQELEEPFEMGKVGSSTMPHKRNPWYSMNVVALSKIVRSYVPLALEVMVGEHERDPRGWQTEWEFISKACSMTDATLEKTIYITENIIVYPGNMERNLYVLKGLMLSEAVMMKLGEKIGRQNAHEVLYGISMKAFEDGIPMKEALLNNEIVSNNLSAEEIDKLLDPHNYIGLAQVIIDRVIKNNN